MKRIALAALAACVIGCTQPAGPEVEAARKGGGKRLSAGNLSITGLSLSSPSAPLGPLGVSATLHDAKPTNSTVLEVGVSIRPVTCYREGFCLPSGQSAAHMLEPACLFENFVQPGPYNVTVTLVDTCGDSPADLGTPVPGAYEIALTFRERNPNNGRVIEAVTATVPFTLE